MIHPTDEQLLAGIAEALKDTVLPELARGTAARKQLQAALEILRRIALCPARRWRRCWRRIMRIWLR